VVEDIVGIQSLSSGLLVAKDEVYPLVEVSRDIVTLQSLWEEGRTEYERV